MDIQRNTKATYNYEILEKFDAGIVLSGAEVKSVKAGRVHLDGAFVNIKEGEAWLSGATISRYAKSGADQGDYKPDRRRKLLLKKKEIAYLAGKTASAGLTIIPLSVYSRNRLVKIKIAVVRGKKKFDKRQSLKEKEFRRRLNSRYRNA